MTKRFCESYTPTDLIKVVWHQIDDAVTYADSGSTPYSPKQVMDNAYQLIFNTFIFAADGWKWNKRTAAEKTIPHLKVFFAATHRDWRLLIQNKMVSPYGATHKATTKPYDGYLQQ